MFACLSAALLGVGAEAFCLTVFFVVWILRIALPVATRWLESEPDTVIYFAPWVSAYEEEYDLVVSRITYGHFLWQTCFSIDTPTEGTLFHAVKRRAPPGRRHSL